jgi:hypothetical protein
MAIKNWNNGKPSFSYEGHANLGVNLNRQKNAPLDISCEYSSVKDMLYYVTEGRFPANGAGVSAAVKDMKKYPYLGQVIALVNPETEEVALYYVKTAEYDATLATDDAMFEHYFEAVGRATLGDNVTIVRNEETGVLSIKGYAAAETGAQLVKTANGLEWVKPDNTTVEGLNTAVAAIESTIGEDDTQGLRLRIKTNEDDIGTLDGKVATLIGEDAGKSARAISAEEVAKIVAGADKDYDTLKEIADYIKSDKTGAAQMQTDISTIKSDLNTAETGLKARMTAAEGEIDALQESVAGIHSHDNKTVLDGITAEKVAAWDAAETNAKTFTTTKIGLTKEDGGDSATEAPTVKAYVDGKVTALNTAIGTQKDRIDNLGALASKSEVGETDLAAALATKINGKADSATTLAGYGIGNAYTKTEVDDAITAAKEAAATDATTKANTAEQNAKDYTDGLAGNYDAKGAADAVQKNVDKVSKAVTTVQGQVNTLNGDATTVGSVAKKIADALDGLALGDTYAPKTHNHTIAQVTGLQDALDEKAVATQVATDITAAKTAVLGEADYAHTVKDAYELANGKVTMADVEGKGYAVKTEVEASIKAVDDKIGAANTAATKLTERVTANETAITKLNGTGEGSVAKTVADKIAEVVAGADKDFDTLKEIADWIMSDTTGAAKMQSDISSLKTLVGDTAVAAQIDNALKVDGVDKFALASELKAVADKVHEHANKAVLDGITAEKVTAWDAAEANAKAYTDEKVGAIPAATAAALGLVKVDDVTIKVAADGTIGVKAISTDLLTQGTDTLVFNCGNA